MQKLWMILLLAVLGLQATEVTAQRRKKNKSQTTAAKTDTTKKAAVGPAGKPKPYKEVITAKTVSTKGLFTIHQQDDKYLVEIPGSLFGRDILVVARLSKAAAGFRSGASYAGDQINSNTIRFEKGPGDRVYMKQLSFQETGRDSTEGMYRNVMNSNIQPIGASFAVKAWTPDSAGAVIDITDYIKGDNDYFFFSPSFKKRLGISQLQADKSYILSAKTFPSNLEIKTVKTYNYTPPTRPGTPPNPYAVARPVTFELNTSLVLLPEVPMQPRYFDDRVGYFTTQTITDFDLNPQGIDRYRYIARYRLEPKPEDIEKYKRGELVEPKKQIVYYIDPTTPKKWVPYLIQGVNDWQAAFEQAGFKNAIVGKPAPSPAEDSSFSLEDARNSVIVYKPSDIPNASGPNVHDPRSGEIMESHINWYHNVMSLVRNWYMVQTAAVDPKARKMVFDDELMGQLIRFVSSHEVGHTLGLRHNFGSSSTVPVEKLRDKAWVEAHGHTPSIMDYARFNYVAQPEDQISETGLFPRIGDYDKWAIEWGYRWYPDLHSADEEVSPLNKFTSEKLKNPRLWWGDGESNRTDPRSQTEDLGDDAMKAGNYGVKNLKRIIEKLPEYTYQANKDYSNLTTLYNEVIGQFNRYAGHVTRNIGGIEKTPKRLEQSGDVYQFTAVAVQKRAMDWLETQVFTTPRWVIQPAYAAKTGLAPLTVVGGIQQRVINALVNAGTLGRLIQFETLKGSEAYRPAEMLAAVRNAVFSELSSRKAIDIYRRQLQKIFVEKMLDMAGADEKELAEMSRDAGIDVANSDIISLVRGELQLLSTRLKSAAGSYQDRVSKYHLQDLQNRIRQTLDPK